ncbi:NAD(P)-binding protein [Pyrenochaeta sp. DS3sAY3a]|nr:NAD(P)-binding protein [Pyrenochaeta sp. DS3sAY3a]
MDFLRSQFTKIPHITPINLSHATVLITGANSGIGLETAREILRSQPKRLILAVRSLERGQAAANELKGQRVDIAILNAGTWTSKFFRSVDGYETDLHVNVLGSAFLSLLLLPSLQIAASSPAIDSVKPHLTFVSSGLHAMAKFPERRLPAGQILQALNNESTYNAQDRYSTTKLISLLWAKEFARRTSEADIIGVTKYLTKASSMLLGRRPEDGARCIVDAALQQGENSHGRYLSEAQVKDEVGFARGPEGERLGKRIWDEVLGIFTKHGVWKEGGEEL